MTTVLISFHWKVHHYQVRLVGLIGLITSALICLNRFLYICIKMRLLTRKDLSCILFPGMAYHGFSLAHVIFLGVRNNWKPRHVGPRLHDISCFIFHSAQRQIGLHCFSDTSHIQNKLKKYTHFYDRKREAYSPSMGAYLNIECSCGAVDISCWRAKTGFNRILLLPLEHQLLIFVSIYCRPPYHLHPQRIRF